MKNILLLAVLSLSLNLFAQLQIPDLKFIFESKSDFTKQFTDKENSKAFTLKIEGVNSQDQIKMLQKTVSNARGVEFFNTELDDQGNLNAKLTVYRYATGFWYWKSFMDITGVPIFTIEGVDYNKNTISTTK